MCHTPAQPPPPSIQPPGTCPSCSNTNLECWQIARGVIQHEDGLVHNRVTWFLTIQGFFFAAFGLGGVKLVELLMQAESCKELLILSLLWCLLIGIAYLGWRSAEFIKPSLVAAKDQNANVEHWWKSQPAADSGNFPRLRGEKLEHSYPEDLPTLFHIAWCYILAATLALTFVHLIVISVVIENNFLPWSA